MGSFLWFKGNCMLRIPIKPYTLLASLVFALVGGGAGYFAGSKIETVLHYSSNVQRLTMLSKDLIRRAELAVDYAYVTLTDFKSLGFESCSPADVARLEEVLLTRGAVRGVGLVGKDNQIGCTVPQAAFAVAKVRQWQESKFVPARNETVSLGHSGELMLVRVQHGDAHVIVATSFDTVLYDFLPVDFRDASSARISLTSGDVVAQFRGDSAPAPDSTAKVERHSFASTRYPLAIEIAVPESVLAGSGMDRTGQLAVAGALIGMLASILLAALFLKPRTARDDLLDALSSGQIIPYYQPIFSLNDGSLSGCEALVRWVRPDGSRVFLDRFIPLAESEGLIAQLTLNMVASCARDLGPLCREWRAFKLSVNLPPDLLLTREFIDALDAILVAGNLPHASVVLELTERQSIQDADAVRSTMALARSMGFRFALDDTGVGHNGLANVQSLPVDFIKIDKCFVDMIDKSQESASIVRMLVSLARDLAMKTVAEGVERLEQMEALKDLGVDEGQGYIVSPALPSAHFVKLAGTWLSQDAAQHRVIINSKPAGPAPGSMDRAA